MKLLSYIAYDNTDMMTPNNIGQGHICQRFDPFGTWILSGKLNVLI